MGKRVACLLLSILLMITMFQLPVEVAAAHENTYVNTGNYHQDLLGVARTQVGYYETGNNKTKYGAWYGLDYQPWCAMFVTWCARKAGIPKSVIANSAVADPRYGYFNMDYKHGSNYTPVPGDLFFKEKFEHVGIVFHVDGEYFYSIEGNSNNDGSDNGTRVLCLKHKIDERYFGILKKSGVAAPAAPKLTTSQKTYSSGQTIKLQWAKVSNAKSYSVTVFRNGDPFDSVNVGSATSYELKYADAGEYLFSVAANYADGKIGFSQHAVTVWQAPSLNVQYQINGGTVAPEYQYVVIGGEGVSFRSSYSTSATLYGKIPVGTLLTASQVRTSGGYTWAKVTYGGKTGWCITSSNYCRRVGYSADENGNVLAHPAGTAALTTWSSGSGEKKPLLDPQTIGLSRENYTFVGWSRALDGSAPVFGQDRTDLTAADIEPSFGSQHMAVTMHAIWRKTVKAITIRNLPTKLSYYTEENLDTTGLKIRVTYTDGTAETLTSGFSLSGFDSKSAGTKQITVDYYGKTAVFEVTVEDRMKYTVENGTAVITDYIQDGGVVIVPHTIDGVPVTAIAPGAFADCDRITGIILTENVTQIGEGAFSGCSALTVVNYTGSREQWDAIQIGDNNEPLLNAELTCDYLVLGDYTGDMKVDNNDVLYLLKHSLFPDMFPVTMTADLNADGVVDNKDVILLLQHSLFPDMFPLTAALTLSVEESADDTEEIIPDETPDGELPNEEEPGEDVADAVLPDSENPDNEEPESELAGGEILAEEIPDSEVTDSEAPVSEVTDGEMTDSEVTDGTLDDTTQDPDGGETV